MTEAPAARRRNADQTRRRLLDAAATAVAREGSGVGIDAIAREAGVSKGGLQHHFATKDALFAALARDAYAQFATAAEAAIEPADLAPGRVLRGFIRASFADLDAPAGGHLDYWAVEAQLSVIPAVREIIAADAQQWRERLTADGLDADVADLLRLTIAGAEAAASVGALPASAGAAELRDRLLRLTHRAAELRALLA